MVSTQWIAVPVKFIFWSRSSANFRGTDVTALHSTGNALIMKSFQRTGGDSRGAEAGDQLDDAADAGDAALAHERGQLGLCRQVAVPPGTHGPGMMVTGALEDDQIQ